MLGRQGEKMSRMKKTLLWVIVLIVAFTSGFGVGAAVWQFDAYNYIWGETTPSGGDAG